MNKIEISDNDIENLLTEYNARIADVKKHWRFDDERRHVIKTWDDTQACPGSGKTTLVAAKLLILAKKWREKHIGICVITHTNVARDEIVSKLHSLPSGFKLASYPHFIGTIQEFVNRFLGLPYIRGLYEFKRLIDSDEGKLEIRRVQIENYTIHQLCGNLYQTCNRADYEEIKDYLGSLHFINSAEDLRFIKQNNSAEIILANGDTDRRKMLSSLKIALCNSGIFQYRDMYAFSSKLMEENQELLASLRKRFPIVIIDEMQDTQKYQDTILLQLFNADNVCLQRFGDPDQAIFDAIGGEEPNESYNDDENLYEIKTTHRFGNDISEKIIGLSYNRLDLLVSDRIPDRGVCQHTVILYKDETRFKVLDTFGEIVDENVPAEGWKSVKAVGGVEGSGRYISQYWPGFDKSNSASSPKPKKLIHAVNICIEKKAGHISANYDLLIQCIVDLLRKENYKTTNNKGRQVYFSRKSLIKWLKDNSKYQDFRSLITTWLLGDNYDSDSWAVQVSSLNTILDIVELNDETVEYLEFDQENEVQPERHTKSNNTYICENGQEIEVATIHSVKGETHDATLILETQFHQKDLHQMLPFIIDAKLNAPAQVRKKEFMRKLYVAATRPRNLLCLALHEDHITRGQVQAMDELGWTIKTVAEEENIEDGKN